MKIVLLGRGHRIGDILDSIHARRSDIIVVSSDESTLRGMAARQVRTIQADPGTFHCAEAKITLGNDDLILIADHLEPTLRATLSNLQAQRLPATQLVFTPVPGRDLQRDFPAVLVRSDRSIYKTEMRELIRKTGSQQKIATIRQLVRDSGRSVVIIWGNPDPDAIGASFGLRELLLQDCRDFIISYMGEYTRPENLAMVTTLKIPTVKYSPDLVQPGTTTFTVDAQPSFFQLAGPMRFDIIVDHHPATDPGPHRFRDVRPRYGSTSTIITEYYRDSGIRMSKRVATALYYGLKTDTANLTRNTSDPDVMAFRFLRQLADENILRTIELSQLPQSTLDFFGIAIANKKIVQDTAFAYIGSVDNPDICVHIADFFIKLSGISWAIVACRFADRVVVVFRSDGFRKHAGHVAEGVFIGYGTAGGHRTMARAELSMALLKAETADPTDVAIENWLMEKLGTRIRALAKPVPVVRPHPDK